MKNWILSQILVGLWGLILGGIIAFAVLGGGELYIAANSPLEGPMSRKVFVISLLLVALLHTVLIGCAIAAFLIGKRATSFEIVLWLMTPFILLVFSVRLGSYYEPAIWLTSWIMCWRILAIWYMDCKANGKTIRMAS